MTNNFERQALEAAKNLIEILKKQIESDIPETLKAEKLELIGKIRSIYGFEE